MNMAEVRDEAAKGFKRQGRLGAERQGVNHPNMAGQRFDMV